MRNSEQFTITQSTQQSSQRFCLQFGGKRSCMAMAVCAAGMFAFAGMATAQGQLSTSPKAGAPSFAMPANGNVPGNGNVPAEPQKLNSQLDQQPQPPVIDFHQGSLTIQAANSSLDGESTGSMARAMPRPFLPHSSMERATTSSSRVATQTGHRARSI
jgi:hypothetical protein